MPSVLYRNLTIAMISIKKKKKIRRFYVFYDFHIVCVLLVLPTLKHNAKTNNKFQEIYINIVVQHLCRCKGVYFYFQFSGIQQNDTCPAVTLLWWFERHVRFIGLTDLLKIIQVFFGESQSFKLCIICGIWTKTWVVRGLVRVIFEQPSYTTMTWIFLNTNTKVFKSSFMILHRVIACLVRSSLRFQLKVNNLKRDPLEIQHPKFENSRLGFIESVHER